MKDYFLMTLSTREKSGKVVFTINGPQFLIISAVLTHLILIFNLLLSCSYSFPCYQVYPTLTYISSIRGHDRITTIAMSLYSISLLFFYTASYAHYRLDLSKSDTLSIVIMGLLQALSLPAIAILDEVTPIHIFNIEKVHLILMVGNISLQVILNYFALQTIFFRYCKERTISKSEKELIVYVAVLMAVWWYAYKAWSSTHEDRPFDEFQSILEWTSIWGSLYLPYMQSRVFKDFRFSISSRRH